ncbi:hypothetical protein [Alkalicoccobacillus porphyridii]|nr:hypothetical protein [Alkalicoccobacillus porphyridii]
MNSKPAKTKEKTDQSHWVHLMIEILLLIPRQIIMLFRWLFNLLS